MGSEGYQLHVFFIPFTAQGHLIPMIDLAKVFANRGVKVSIIATPLSASLFEKTVDRTRRSGLHIEIHRLEFSSSDVNNPAGYENMDSFSSFDALMNVLRSLEKLQKPLERLVEIYSPHCIVSDMFLPWTVEVATKFGIPRLVFNGSGFFQLCVSDSLRRYKPQESVASETEPFIVPGLPHAVELTISQMADFTKTNSDVIELWEQTIEADLRSFGMVMNSFYELEKGYIEHYTKVMGKKAWHVGPVSLCNRNALDMAERGKKASIVPDDCLKWLDTKATGSVMYVCFGSMSRFPAPQIMEIALALEASNHPFLWVVGNMERSTGNEWLPEGFEERMQGKGLIVRGWAPQVLILNHPAVGVFVTHCGWNSILEGISAGVAMVTWPVFAEQFYNEKLITQVLKIGTPVGAQFWFSWEAAEWPLIGREKIEKAISMLMDGGDEAEEMRKRAKEMGDMALRAVQVGGSSFEDMGRLIEELKMYGQEAFAALGMNGTDHYC